MILLPAEPGDDLVHHLPASGAAVDQQAGAKPGGRVVRVHDRSVIGSQVSQGAGHGRQQVTSSRRVTTAQCGHLKLLEERSEFVGLDHGGVGFSFSGVARVDFMVGYQHAAS